MSLFANVLRNLLPSHDISLSVGSRVKRGVLCWCSAEEGAFQVLHRHSCNLKKDKTPGIKRDVRHYREVSFVTVRHKCFCEGKSKFKFIII